MILNKQPTLKPQDVAVVLKLALADEPIPTFSELANALHISASEVHGATRRAMASRLVDRVDGSLRVNKTGLLEFLVHGVKYAFPLAEGPATRGMPTGASSPALRSHFNQTNELGLLVWPDAEGEARGQSVCPLYPAVPAACKKDARLYAALAALDAVRGGAARERELAISILTRLLV